MGYKILRLGGVNTSASRLLDLIEDERVESLNIFYDLNENKYIDNFIKIANFFGLKNILNKKVKLFPMNYSSLLFRGCRKILKITHCTPPFFKYLTISKSINYIIKNSNLIWVGDNDFDGSNFLIILLNAILKENIPIIRSYKETRFENKWEEEEMLNLSNKLIFPNSEYIKFFGDLYNIQLKSVSFADLDWRYSKLIKYVKSKNIKKISSIDGEPHICILTGRAIWDPTESRSGKRYYYLPMIKNLINEKIHVHLHAFKIIKKGEEPIFEKNNPYYNLAKKSLYFHIEEPLNLDGSINDYFILKRYDFGILHNTTIDNESNNISRFENINIPNRLYEYQIADVFPIIKEGISTATEQVIKETNFGVIYKNYSHLTNKINKISAQYTISYSKNIIIDSIA